MWEKFQKEFVIGLDMQQLHCLGCDWIDSGRMFWNQGIDILVSSIHVVTNATNLKTISNVQIHAHCVATIPTKITGKCTTATPCILKVEIDEIVSTQNPLLIILSIVHLKDEIDQLRYH